MISNILLILSMIFLIIGAIGINRFEGISAKLLTCGLIDTMALILLIIALMMKSGFNGMTIKLGIVLLFILLTNPVINHVLAKAAKENSDD